MSVYQDYQDRRNTWLDYFSTMSLLQPFDGDGCYLPEHYIPQYLKDDGPDIELMRARLINAQSLREKTLLTLLMREFETFEDLDLDDIVVTPREERIKKRDHNT